MSSIMGVLRDVQSHMARSEHVQAINERLDQHEARINEQRREYVALEGRVTRLEAAGTSSTASSVGDEVDPCKLEVQGFVRDSPKEDITRITELLIQEMPARLNAPRWAEAGIRIILPFVSGSVATLQFVSAQHAKEFRESFTERRGGFGSHWVPEEGSQHRIYVSPQRTEKQKTRSRVLYRCRDAVLDAIDPARADLVTLDVLRGCIEAGSVKIATWRRRSCSLEWKEKGLQEVGLISQLATLREEALDAE